LYIQVTTKCNMKCAHCMYACTPGKGKHMPMDIFRKAVDASAAYDSYIAIGGGEPTLHPDLLAMLGIASFLSCEPIFMVTNGTCEKKLWRTLIDAKRAKKIDIHVSKDIWHDMSLVKDWVWEDADRYKLWWGDDSSVRQRTLIRRGRAKRNWKKLLWECEQSGIRVLADEAECGSPRISSDGRVWADVPGGGATGTLDDPDAIERAYDVIRAYEYKKMSGSAAVRDLET
jgi:organic radical activating enzyme